MPVLAAFAFANLKSDIGAVLTWLSHRSFWQLVCMGLAGLAVLQHFQLADARHDRNAAMAQLQKMSAPRDVQKTETAKRIEIVKERVRHADGVAKTIEQAPLPGQCRTPKEVLDADI